MQASVAQKPTVNPKVTFAVLCGSRRTDSAPNALGDSRPMPLPCFRAIRAAVLIGTSLIVASCAGGVGFLPGNEQVVPHPRVARALTKPVQGIDVSKYQGRIDWAAVKAGGTHFAFIKATEGGDHLDERFAENWAGSRAAGVPRGAYHFVYWCRDAREQVEWFKRNVPADPSALPPVLDLEWNHTSRTCGQKLPKEQALPMIKVMLAGMHEHTGKRPIIYTDPGFYKDVLEGELDEYPLWARSVANEPEARYGERPWMMWQYTAYGRVPGVATHVDRNAFWGDHSHWAHFLSTDCDVRSKSGTHDCSRSKVALAE
jgi:lysozyme